MAESSETTDKWRYVVALGKFVVHLIFPGMTKAISILIPSMVFQLQMDYTTVGFLVPMQYGVLYLACPLSNYLSTKFGHRCFSSVSGFLSGVSMMGTFFSQSPLSLGCSFFFAGLFSSPLRQSSTVILHEHFGEKYGMAIIFTQLGGQIGGIILPYLTALCLEAYGMRGALLCLSGIFYYQAAIGATFRAPRIAPRLSEVEMKKRNNQREADFENSTLLQGQETCLQNKEIRIGSEIVSTYEGSSDEGRIQKDGESLKSKPIKTWIVEFVSSLLALDFLKRERVFVYLFIPCHILNEVSFAIWITFSASYGVSVGLHEYEAVYLPIVGSLSGLIGRLVLVGVLYKRPHLAPHTFPVNTAISAIGLLVHPISPSLFHLLICSLFAGFGIYGSTSSFHATVALKFKKEDFPIASAIVFMISGIILLLSGTIAGLFYEHFESFKTIFIATGVFLLISSGLFSSFLFVEARMKRHSSKKI